MGNDIELKTLKDMHIAKECVSVNELKREVIKWIKVFDRRAKGDNQLLIPIQTSNPTANEKFEYEDVLLSKEVVNFLKYFLNITKEDLK